LLSIFHFVNFVACGCYSSLFPGVFDALPRHCCIGTSTFHDHHQLPLAGFVYGMGNLFHPPASRFGRRRRSGRGTLRRTQTALAERREDWSEWDFELGGQRGTIRQKWKDDPQQWELRTYTGAIITMRTSWNGDFKQWRISDNSVTLNLKSKWTNQLDEWLVQDDNYGNFYMYTLRSRDPRDWAIDDKLYPEISEEMKFAMVFIVIFNSMPQN
jgi:hypothetical protein